MQIPKALLRSGVNFINVLRTAIALIDPKSVKNTVESLCLFMLLGSTSVKAVRRLLMKLSPERGGNTVYKWEGSDYRWSCKNLACLPQLTIFPLFTITT